MRVFRWVRDFVAALASEAAYAGGHARDAAGGAGGAGIPTPPARSRRRPPAAPVSLILPCGPIPSARVDYPHGASTLAHFLADLKYPHCTPLAAGWWVRAGGRPMLLQMRGAI